jgi:hypothetical protein
MGDMKTESLSANREPLTAGQSPAEIGAGGLPFLGSGSEAGRAALAKFEAAGMVERSKLEMGGGGGPVDKYFSQYETTDSAQINKFLQWADEQEGKGATRVNIGNDVIVPLVEYRSRMAQILEGRQKVSQAVDWKAGLQPEQRQRLQAFETKIAGLDPGQLQIVSNRLKELQAQSLTDGWQSKEIKEADANFCLKIVAEKLTSISHGQKVRVGLERAGSMQDLMRNLSGEARGHLQLLTERFKKEKNLGSLEYPDLVACVQAEYRKAGLIGRNAPLWLLPPRLKRELLPIFGLPMEMPVLLDPKEENA